jgi:hypothetical protein
MSAYDPKRTLATPYIRPYILRFVRGGAANIGAKHQVFRTICPVPIGGLTARPRVVTYHLHPNVG